MHNMHTMDFIQTQTLNFTLWVGKSAVELVCLSKDLLLVPIVQMTFQNVLKRFFF